jgi:uncharacterized protein YcsI (UPF0317 family)
MRNIVNAISADLNSIRKRIRYGEWSGTTSGMAPAHVQGNVAILPREFADDFMRFCQLNPKPCPLIGVSDPGNPALPALGADLDVRTDVPRYRVFENGRCVDEPQDLMRWWRSDLVAFVLGCSLSFEQALLEAGLRLQHVERGTAVPMYKTTVETRRAGRFHGPLVVSMRPFKPANAIRAIQITSRFPTMHGAPVHIGFPGAIGIRDLSRPDYGTPVDVAADELPLFWACGVTPQAVVEAANVPFCITHYPGAMLITDLRNSDVSVL